MPIRDSNLSNLGDGPNSTYMVYDSSRKEIQTNCFVLKPSKERNAFIAFDCFVSLLDKTDPRFEELSNWRDRLEKLWNSVKEKEENQ
ncbi:MAG: hypothetical protein ABIH92_00550 [Nanoarchaeota archaeon]